MKTKRFIISTLCFAVLTNIGCGGGSTSGNSKVEDSTAVEKGEGQGNEQNDSVKNPNSATFLFDASKSMRGYLKSAGDSRFIGVISAIGNIPNSTVVHLYGEKEGESIAKNEFDRKLNRGDIAWSNESDLKAMVQSMINHTANGDDVCFLLTDGILSGSNSDINSSPGRSYNIKMREKMSEDLLSMLSPKCDNLCALIVRYKAKFNGTYSCYNNAPKKLVDKERPFFVIALGKWGNIKYIEEELKNRKASGGLSTAYEDIVMIGDSRSYKKIKLSAAEGLNPKGNKLVIKKEFRSDNITLSADLEQLPDYMQTEEYMNANIELYVQHGQKALKGLDKKYYNISVNNINGKNILKLSINAGQLQNSKLVFKLKYAMPEWVESKSDDNDLNIATDPSKLNKTFNLKYFVGGFTALHNGKYIKEQELDFK